jgi:CRP/FNR family transcriptional regulator, cyclic AMP receptor protein
VYTVYHIAEGFARSATLNTDGPFGPSVPTQAELDQPHTADVRALEASQFHVADAGTLQDPIVLLYVAALLARRLDAANTALVELKGQIEAGQPRSEIGKTIEKIEGLLGPSGASLVYAGYPYDPYA